VFLARVFRAPAAGTAFAAALVVAVAVPTARQSIAFDRLMATTDTRVLAAQWIEEHRPDGASVYQTGMEYGHVQPRPRERYDVSGFNIRLRQFATTGATEYREPDLVVVLDSPLAIFSEVPERLGPVLDDDYVQRAEFRPWPRDRRPAKDLYEQQDAFYVPFADPGVVARPGPDIRIFERRR
jgi:hypothetical protein